MMIKNIGKRIYMLIVILALTTSMGCQERGYHITKARIIERRDAGNGKIRLSYIFKVGQTTIAGVKIVDNIAITTDSCEVAYQISNPLENKLKLP